MLWLWQAAPGTQLCLCLLELLSSQVLMSILTLSGSERNVLPLFPQHLWYLSDICFAIFLTQLPSLSAQKVGSGAHGCTSLSFNWIVSQEAPSKSKLSQKCETLLPETSFYCLNLVLKLSRERHTFQGIWSIWLWKWDGSFRPTAWHPKEAECI